MHLLLLFTLGIIFSFDDITEHVSTFASCFKKEIEDIPLEVRCFQVFCLLITLVVINYIECLAGHALLCQNICSYLFNYCLDPGRNMLQVVLNSKEEISKFLTYITL